MTAYRNAVFCYDPDGKRSGIAVERDGLPIVVPLVFGNADYDAITTLVADGEFVIDDSGRDSS